MARLAFHHVGRPNIDAFRGLQGFYQILRCQLHIPSRPEQKQSERASEEHAVEDTKKKDVVPEFVVPETGVGSLGTLTTGSKLTIKASDIRERYNRNLRQNLEQPWMNLTHMPHFEDNFSTRGKRLKFHIVIFSLIQET